MNEYSNGRDMTASQTRLPQQLKYRSFLDIYKEQVPEEPQEPEIDESWEKKHRTLYAVTDLVAGLGNVIAAAHGATPQQLTSATAANNARMQKLIETRRKYADSYRAGLVNAAYQDAQVQRQQAQQAQAQANWQQSFKAQERARKWQQANTEAQQEESNRRYHEQQEEAIRHNKALEGARTQGAGEQVVGNYENMFTVDEAGNFIPVRVNMDWVAKNITTIEDYLERSSMAEAWSTANIMDSSGKRRYQNAARYAIKDRALARWMFKEMGIKDPVAVEGEAEGVPTRQVTPMDSTSVTSRAFAASSDEDFDPEQFEDFNPEQFRDR